VDLQQVIERTLKLQQHSLQQKGILVDCPTAPGLPAVSGDANQIMQVLLNLITNAEQGIAAVRDRGTIRIRMGAADGRVWVTVQDDGAGIPPEAEPYLFDPFFTTKAPGKGTGMGLSVSLALVREHGGTLAAENVPGGGALFSMTLLAATDEPPVVAPAPKQADLKYRSVLVVDDEQGILDLVRTALSLRGMRVDCAANGQEAVAILAKRSYDCVLCDWKMPGMTARQVFEHLPQPAHATRRFIVMSGDLNHPETQNFLNLTRVAVLQKPFTLPELIAMVGQELERETVN
jgi:CheY-like chemotaxis protein